MATDSDHGNQPKATDGEPRRASGMEPAPETTTGTTTGTTTDTDHEQPDTLSHVRSPTPEADEKPGLVGLGTGKAAAGGQAVINQQETIPTTGKRIPTTKWEYITFCIFCTTRFPCPVALKRL